MEFDEDWRNEVLEERTTFWDKDPIKNIKYFGDEGAVIPKEETKSFDFEKEIQKFKGGRSRDALYYKKKGQ